MSTKITQIDDKSSTIAWSPQKDHADVIALGTKVRQFVAKSLALRYIHVMSPPCAPLRYTHTHNTLVRVIYRTLAELGLQITVVNWIYMI